MGDKSNVNFRLGRYILSACLTDTRHLLTFLEEKSKAAKHGYVICRCPRPLQLHDKITALPWFCL